MVRSGGKRSGPGQGVALFVRRTDRDVPRPTSGDHGPSDARNPEVQALNILQDGIVSVNCYRNIYIRAPTRVRPQESNHGREESMVSGTG